MKCVMTITGPGPLDQASSNFFFLNHTCKWIKFDDQSKKEEEEKKKKKEYKDLRKAFTVTVCVTSASPIIIFSVT